MTAIECILCSKVNKVMTTMDDDDVYLFLDGVFVRFRFSPYVSMKSLLCTVSTWDN